MVTNGDARHVFVTGGLGFIGSHCAVVLLERGFEVTIFDDLSNTSEEVYERLKQVVGERASKLNYIEGDIKDRATLEEAFSKAKYDAVIHFAGRKFVNESMTNPMLYYENNMLGTINLIHVASKNGCKNMVFSSSCTVYGNPSSVPISEDHPLSALCPYGRTKLFVEEMFRDVAFSDSEWSISLLRYFNPIGNHPSGMLGEEQKGVPTNLLPYIMQVVKGQREYLSVYGNDYNTRDGTPVRDYIHVMDLAEAHVKAVQRLWAHPDISCEVFNLGTGVGSTVLEIIKAFEAASGVSVNHKIVGRREGDAEAVWAATQRAEKVLGWKAKYDVLDMCKHTWKWMTHNPNGYASKV